MKIFQITNTGPTPRGIPSADGRIVTIGRGETRAVTFDEALEMRYRQKISGGDTLTLSADGEAVSAPKKEPKAPKTEKAPKEPKAPKAPKQTPAPAAADAPAPGSKEALQVEARDLKIPGWENFGTKRLIREIAAAKAAPKE